MKTYGYYPGCSLEKMGLSYHLSTMETARKLGVEFKELEDWNCCGATAYFHVDELLAYTLSARNLAIAEEDGMMDVICPCSGCYKNMYSANAHLKEEPDLAEHINFALEEDNLHFSGETAVRHLIEVFVYEVGVEEIERRISRPLDGLRVAPYYGCQILRPKKENGELSREAVENPQFFENLLSAVGADPVDYPGRLRCCGGSLILTSRRAALSMVRNLLQSAVDRDAAVIATACPLCQMNLECYQQQVNREFDTDLSVPVLYFTQVVGLALGIAPERLGIGKELTSAEPMLSLLEGAKSGG